MFAAHEPIGSLIPTSSSIDVVAPIVTREPSRVTPTSPASFRSRARAGRSRW
jgi:hypothetical protein